MENTIFNLGDSSNNINRLSRKWFPLNFRSSLDRLDLRGRTSFYLHDCDDPDRHDRDFKEN